MGKYEMYKALEPSEDRVEELRRTRDDLDNQIQALQHKIVQRRDKMKIVARQNQFETNLFYLGFEKEDAIRSCGNTLNIFYQNQEINKLFIAYSLGAQDGRTEDLRAKK